jgi:hypothetical protein
MEEHILSRSLLTNYYFYLLKIGNLIINGFFERLIFEILQE